MSTSALYYKASGKVSPIGPIVMFSIGGALALALGFAYAYATFYIPIIYINVLITVGAGFAIGLAVSYSAKIGKVRNRFVSTAIATICGLIAIYVAWAVWLNIFLETDAINWSPGNVIASMIIISDFGAWEVFGTTPTGLPLFGIWLAEAGIIVGVSAFIARQNTAVVPFCEDCQKWAKEVIVTEQLEYVENPEELKKQLETGNINGLLEAPKSSTTRRFSSVIVHSCEGCQDKHHLTVSRTIVTLDDDGKDESETEVVLENLIIDKESYDQIFTIR